MRNVTRSILIAAAATMGLMGCAVYEPAPGPVAYAPAYGYGYAPSYGYYGPAYGPSVVIGGGWHGDHDGWHHGGHGGRHWD